ncbi:MAG TPA: glycogen debranching enzyme N-terminal domain-containing protein, partial [Chloroflexota bacterium]|nr:glycogen debranching enzyme N-terminal domain-containing protein [Chloroflexota bacterium]
MVVEREEAFSLEEALTHEWLVTDGRGGYASGTVIGPLTRRYHGLLVAPLAPPLGRHVLLAKLEETVVVGTQAYRLSANEFEDGTVSPRGFEHLADFRVEEGVPIGRYDLGDVAVEKRVWMERGVTATHVSYTVSGSHSSAITLRLVPLCSFREFHHETIGSEDWVFQVTRLEGGLRVLPYAGSVPYDILISSEGGWSFRAEPRWWWHFLHREERNRGQDYLEDCFALGEISVELAAGDTAVVSAALASGGQGARLAALAPLPLDPLAAPSRASLAALAQSPSLPRDDFAEQLRRAADDFIVSRPLPDGSNGATVLAGYHWFGDWGRDTFIALPGLALASGRLDDCRRIVTTFAQYVDKGMLPNRFPDSGAPLNDGDYNTVDASLWFFHAVDALDRLTGGGLIAEVF